jgi:hypothetical protein
MTADSTRTQARVTPDEALTQSLDEMERGATRLKFAYGLREQIAEKARPKFEENHEQWDRFKHTVLRSARQIGTFAEELALFEAEVSEHQASAIMDRHVAEAIRVVKEFCPAGLVVGPRFKWCPDA